MGGGRRPPYPHRDTGSLKDECQEHAKYSSRDDITAEVSRILTPGGHVIMVNDNVRYAGEEVPVDLILSNMAEAFGLVTDKIWTLARGKGNSIQQMGVHGRSELRKCVYVWQKSTALPATRKQ